jgi:hypothetical protein
MALTRRDLIGLGTVGGLTVLAGCTPAAGAVVTPTGPAPTGTETPPPPPESTLDPRQVPTPRYTSLEPDDSAPAIDGDRIDQHLKSLGAYVAGSALRTVRIQPGTYVRTTTITLPSGVRLLAAGATFRSQIPGPEAPLLDMTGVSDVVVEGGTWDGDKAHPLVISEWKHVIRVVGAHRITVDSVVAINGVGDGIYVGSAETPCRDVTIRSVKCAKNGRNGLSITSVIGFRCSDSIFTGNGDRSPQSGGCVEPNHAKAPIEDVVFTRCSFTRNRSRGFLVVMRPQSPVIDDSIQLIDCTIDKNANPWGGTMVCGGLVLLRPRGVLVSGGVIKRSHTGITVQGLRGSDPVNAPHKGKVRLVDVDVHDNHREGLIVLNGAGELTAERVRFFDNSREPSGYFSGIMLAQGSNMTFTDCVSTGARLYGLQASDPVRKVTLKHCDLRGNAKGTLDAANAGVTVIK